MGNECTKSTVETSYVFAVPEQSKVSQALRATNDLSNIEFEVPSSNKSSNIESQQTIPVEKMKESQIGNFVDLKIAAIKDAGNEKIIKYEDGSTYTGQVRGNMKHGHGVLQDKFGNLYDGEFRNDKREGYGVFRTAEGSVYKGPWKDDLQDGLGEEQWSDGSTYKGGYSQGMKQGRGTYVWDDGTRYVGEFVSNLMEGTVA